MGKETISSPGAERLHARQLRRRSAATSRASASSASAASATTSTRSSSQIRKILRTAGQHNIALFGAGHLGQAIASSDIFADHGFRIVAIFDTDPAKVGQTRSARTKSAASTELRHDRQDEDIVVGVLAVPTAAAQTVADDLVARRREDHLQLLRGAAAGARRRSPSTPRARPSTCSTRCTST